MRLIITFLLLLLPLSPTLAQTDSLTTDIPNNNRWPSHGFRIFLGASACFGVNDVFRAGEGYLKRGVHTSLGYQLNSLTFIGAGLQYQTISVSGNGEGPGTNYDYLNIFLNPHFDFLRKRTSPTLDIKLGKTTCDIEGYYFAASIGLRVKRSTFSFGYDIQHVHRDYRNYYRHSPNIAHGIFTSYTIDFGSRH